MHSGDPHPTVPDRDLQDLVADALAIHDEGGETALASFLAQLGPRADEVRDVLGRFLALGMLTTRSVECAALPEQLGDFRLLRRLGAGGMGVVFLAEQMSLRREVALKIVRPEFQIFEGALERFRREIDAVARLRHPGVVPILAVGEERGVPYFAMELVEGRSGEDLCTALAGRDPATLTGLDLWHVLRTSATADAATASDPATPPALFAGAAWQACARLGAQLARTMQHVHLRGIVHRDLKPSNVMLTPHGQALVLDFGLAHVEAGERITRTGSELGSPAYMSPEQLRAEPLDERTDVYSLGATLFQLLCLVPPFVGRDAHDLRNRILAAVPPRARGHNRALPRDLEIVCLKALDRDRQRRYPSMAEFAADLEAVAEGRAVRARPLGRVQRVLRWAGRHRPLAAGLGVAALFVVATPLLLWFQERAATRRIADEFARAQRNLEVSKEAVRTMLVRVGEVDLGATPGAEQLRVRLLEEAVALYERLLADQSDDPALRLQRGQTLEQMGKMLVDLGRHTDAEKALAETIRVCGDDDPTVETPVLLMRARARQAVAALQLNRGEFELASEALTRKRHELELLQGRTPGDPQVRAALATTLCALADCERQRVGDDARSAPVRYDLLQRAAKILEAVHAERPDNVAVGRLLASVMQASALALQDQARYADAQGVLAREIDFVASLADDQSARPRKGELLMLAHSARGSTHFAAGEFEAAAASHRESVAFAEQLVHDYPTIAGYVSRLGAMLANLAVAEQRLGHHADSLPLLRRAIAQQRAALQLSPDFAEARRFVVAHLHALLDGLGQAGGRAEVLATARELVAASSRAEDAVAAAEAVLAVVPRTAVDATPRDPAPPATAPDDAAEMCRAAMADLLEAERRGWPDGVDLDDRTWQELRRLPEFTALRARRSGH